MAEKTAIVFCSASGTIAPEFNDAAREVVRLLCTKGYAIASGGTIKGTMRVVADAARDCGAHNIGVIPRFMEDVVYPDMDETIWTDTMAERKEILRAKGKELAVALPGGIGTLDELFETLTLAKLDKYHGRVVAYNLNGFYDRVRDLLDYYVETGMLDKDSRGLISFPESISELEQIV